MSLINRDRSAASAQIANVALASNDQVFKIWGPPLTARRSASAPAALEHIATRPRPPAGPAPPHCPNQKRQCRISDLDWNEMVKLELQLGRCAQFIALGWSLFPRVHPGDCCRYWPSDGIKVEVGDIVFCQVYPGFRYITATVIDMDWEEDRRLWPCEYPCRVYVIGSTSGEIDGHCRQEHIYGKLVEILYP